MSSLFPFVDVSTNNPLFWFGMNLRHPLASLRLSFNFTLKLNMPACPYIFSLSRPDSVEDNLRALFSVAGHISPLQGSTIGGIQTTIYITRKATKTKEKLLNELNSLGVYSDIRLVELSGSMIASALSDLRDLYRKARYDASRLSDDELRAYVSDLLQHRYRYYLASNLNSNKQGFELSLEPVPTEHQISDEQRKLLLEEEQNESFPELISETIICYSTPIEDEEPPPPPDWQME
ncbi:hypothetical protein WG906_01005 [Pedobacter sp. P351]|uniref:hypothetical protein n=1 Tax=Pedobacter superstes TaxID=3133441 RepID=UPI00309724AE